LKFKAAKDLLKTTLTLPALASNSLIFYRIVANRIKTQQVTDQGKQRPLTVTTQPSVYLTKLNSKNYNVVCDHVYNVLQLYI